MMCIMGLRGGMYRLNSSGPGNNSFGNPQKMLASIDVKFLIETEDVLPLKYGENHSSVVLTIFNRFI